MELASIKKLKSRNGTSKVLRTFFKKEIMSELVKLASTELARRALVPILGKCPPISLGEYGPELEIEFAAQSDANKLVSRIKAINIFEIDHWEKTKGTSSMIVVGFDRKTISHQLKSLPSEKKEIAFDVLDDCAISIAVHIKGKQKTILNSKGKKGAEKESNSKTMPKRSILTASALTLHDLGLNLKTKYSIKVLDAIVDKGIQKYAPAVELLSAILKHARELNKKPERVRSSLVVYDLGIVEKNFITTAAAVSALHANPKALLMFTSKTSFVLFDGKRPLARFGSKLPAKMTMKKKFEECRKECGTFPGNTKAIMDVLDAEGKTKDAAVKELFNDLSKHVVTNSSGVASRAAKRIRKAMAIQSRIDWQSFNTAFSEASKHVKEIKYSPMVERMEDAVKELHRKRNVLKLGQMKWQEIFEKKKLDWLGALTADILEDEVNRKKDAKLALSCVANWMENVVECSLRVHHLGTVGDEFKLEPCKTFTFRNHEIELQDIMKSGPKWT